MADLKTLSWDYVGDYLRVPSSKLNAIKSENSTDRQRLAAVVRYWILRDPYASWRRLIRELDCISEWHDVADRIRDNAEKQTGQ